ncbi:MAG: hypothetical protein BMS9Abin37_1013 [Acidobacteriota bacterium]|nr:MAG: hypothetical protein BMS9Abin37_1013 [Acidobacteriota bacterium]
MSILSTALSADTRLSIQHTESGKQPQIQTIMVTSGKVRMEQGTDDNTLLLYDQANNTFFAIQPDEKSYMEFDPEKAGAMMDQASPMQQQMMAQLQESLKELPEEQRQKMMEMMKRSGQTMPGLPEEPVRYESRAGSDSSGGFTCHWVEAYQGERKVRELCLTEPASMGMPSSDRETMMAMQKSMKALAKRLGSAGMFQDNMPDGFPVHVRHFGSSGQVTSEQQVQGVNHDGLDPRLFEIPAGYQKRELPTLPQQ